MFTCQQIKVEHQAPSGKFQIFIYTRMEMGENYYGFRYWIAVRLEKHDVVWVIVDRLTKSAHFMPI